jgi:hypothetical protein
MSIIRKRREEIDLNGVDWGRVDATTDEDILRWSEGDPDTPSPSTEEELAEARWVWPDDRAEEPRRDEASGEPTQPARRRRA